MTNRQKKVACVGLILFTVWNSTTLGQDSFLEKKILCFPYCEYVVYATRQGAFYFEIFAPAN